MAANATIAAAEPRSLQVPPTKTRERLVLWLLGSAVFATAAGAAAATFRGDGTAINAFLFLSLEWPHVTAGKAERAAMLMILGAAFGGMLWRRWPVLLPVAAYLFAEAAARRNQGGQIFSEWAVLAHAPRYLTPLALIALSAGFERKEASQRRWLAAGDWILRIAIAVVFSVHGIECIKGHPHFIDLLLSSGRNLAGIRITEANALVQLEWIGLVDCAVAAMVLLWPNRAVLAWAAFWGGVSAFARVTAVGWGAYPDVLLRSTHVLVPLALLFLRRHTADVRAEALPITMGSTVPSAVSASAQQAPR